MRRWLCTVTAAALLLSPGWAAGGVLAHYLAGIGRYRAPARPQSPPPTLRRYWQELVERYPYPHRLMARRRITPRDLGSIPEVYVRRHPFPEPRRADGRLAALIRPFRPYIREASRLFGVPEAIIGGVILQESGGNPLARARTTSAKGLMQTIDTTFRLAQRALARRGIAIRDPYEPRDSILAGTWYLSYCFDLARRDYPALWDRSRLDHWSRALEYYYAGPQWGRRPRPIVEVYTNGRRLVIRKGAYSQAVMAMARELG